MAFERLAVVTNKDAAKVSPYQVRMTCDGADQKLVDEILEAIESHLDNCWGNYTGEEYEALTGELSSELQRLQREKGALIGAVKNFRYGEYSDTEKEANECVAEILKEAESDEQQDS